jgi:hypothetical protein
MPKLELKPWRLNEPQVVLASRHDESRLVVAFRKDEEGEIYKEMWEERDCGGGDMRIYLLDEISLADWKDDILDLLGIPETIEVSNEPN